MTIGISASSTWQHIRNQQNPAIQFTELKVEKDRRPTAERCRFWMRKLNDKAPSSAWRSTGKQSTHSGPYLNFESHHPVTATKCSLVDALFSRAEAIITNEEQKQAEISKSKQELLANDYPARFIFSRLARIEKRNWGSSVRSREAEDRSLRGNQRRQTTVLAHVHVLFW